MQKNPPILNWLRNYKKAWLAGDVFAGLTVGIMLVPQGMAYAMLAGLPPIHGLYAATLPLIIYAIFGTSRQLAVGPVAIDSLLVAAGVGVIATVDSADYITLAALLALMVGVIQFLTGFLKLGFLVNFLSRPVISGFTTAAAIIIAFSQLKTLLGLDIAGRKIYDILNFLFHNINQINLSTLLLSAFSISILIAIKKSTFKIPGPLVVVLFGIAIVYFFNLNEEDVQIIGLVPAGLPSFKMPEINVGHMRALFPTAITIAFIGFMEAIAVAKSVQRKHKDYEIENNQELMALGLANIGGSFFKAFPVTGGFSRTAVNDQAGAKSGLASLISAFLVILTLVFLTEYFYYLPTAALAAIIVVAIFGLIDITEAKHLWKTDKRDFYLFLATACGTLFLGVAQGIIIGASLSIIMLIYNISYPHIAVLGRSKDGKIFRNIRRFEEVEQLKDILIIRFDAALNFANINYFKDFIWAEIQKRNNISNLIIDAAAINNLDSSATHILKDLLNELIQQNITLYLVDVKGPVRDKLKKGEATSLIGEEHILNNINEAVELIENNTKPSVENRGFAIQSNFENS